MWIYTTLFPEDSWNDRWFHCWVYNRYKYNGKEGLATVVVICFQKHVLSSLFCVCYAMIIRSGKVSIRAAASQWFRISAPQTVPSPSSIWHYSECLQIPHLSISEVACKDSKRTAGYVNQNLAVLTEVSFGCFSSVHEIATASSTLEITWLIFYALCFPSPVYLSALNMNFVWCFMPTPYHGSKTMVLLWPLND